LPLKESQTIAEIADHLYSFLPGTPHPYASQTISFQGVAAIAGVGKYWSGGSKGPAVTQLLSALLERHHHLVTIRGANVEPEHQLMAIDLVSGAMLRPNSPPLCVPDVLLPHGAGQLSGALIDQRRGLGLPLSLANRPGRDFVGGSRPRLACVLILANDPLELILIG